MCRRPRRYSAAATFIDISLLGKFPVDLGAAKVWGGVGVMYSMNLAYEFDGTDVSDGTDLSDLFVIAAVGADIDAGAVSVSPA